MSDSADYTIKGFLYQFNKTIVEIFKSAPDSEICVEGIIEDIDVTEGDKITAIQCKYHETKDEFTPSLVYKPILLMMEHYARTSGNCISYILFIHVKNTVKAPTIQESDLRTILCSQNKKLIKYIKNIPSDFDFSNFLRAFRIELGPSFIELESTVYAHMEECGMTPEEIAVFAYPNAINKIASLSIKHNADDRKITKRNLLEHLSTNKKTAISKWTLALRNRKDLLLKRKAQIKPSLDQNSRLRYFLIGERNIEKFGDEIVKFISDCVKKYNSKAAHTETPLFCLEVGPGEFLKIQSRLYEKGVVSTDGYVGDTFFDEFFFRKPLTENSKANVKKEFLIRILSWNANQRVINSKKADDLFILGDWIVDGIEATDVNIEALGIKSFQEARYLMRMTDAID